MDPKPAATSQLAMVCVDRGWRTPDTAQPYLKSISISQPGSQIHIGRDYAQQAPVLARRSLESRSD